MPKPSPNSAGGLGNPQATLQRVADQAGVSATTVSRVLSGQARRFRISRKTELAVRGLAEEMNFVPNHLAWGLRLKKTLTIGLIIPDIANPFFASIARQVALGTRQHGYSVILCDSQEEGELETRSIDLLRGRHVEGMVICPVGQSADHLRQFEHGGLPVVLVDRYFPNLALPSVAADNLGGAREATQFLIEHGHRRIACLQGLRGTAPNELRVQGYKEALAQNHLPLDETLIVGESFGEQNGYLETKLLLQSSKEVTAIMAVSNQIALGALRALAEERRRIPEDISIISFDDQPYSDHLATPLTTVAQPVTEMGNLAVKLLFDQIESSAAERRGSLLLPTRLLIRKSVKRMKGQ